jgi:ribosomal protein S20
MPITQQASKKLRRDRKRALDNALKRLHVREAVKAARKSPSKKTLQKAYKVLDKASKNNLIHPHKSARLKSRLSRLVKS